MTDLSSLSVTFFPGDINNGGQVAGSGSIAGDTHAFLYTPASGIQDLGIPGGKVAGGVIQRGLNNRGQVVGETNNGPWVYAAGTGIFNLMTPQFFASDWVPPECLGSAINDQAQVVGACRIGPRGPHRNMPS